MVGLGLQKGYLRLVVTADQLIAFINYANINYANKKYAKKIMLKKIC